MKKPCAPRVCLTSPIPPCSSGLTIIRVDDRSPAMACFVGAKLIARAQRYDVKISYLNGYPHPQIRIPFHSKVTWRSCGWRQGGRCPLKRRRNAHSKKNAAPRAKLRLPDLDHSKAAVPNSLRSPESQRGYRHSIDEFIAWYCSEPRLSFNKTVVTPSSPRAPSLYSSDTEHRAGCIANNCIGVTTKTCNATVESSPGQH